MSDSDALLLIKTPLNMAVTSPDFHSMITVISHNYIIVLPEEKRIKKDNVVVFI